MFHGSQEYPGENELDQFWEKSGGWGTAVITSERTKFYSIVHPKDLAGSLKRMLAAATAPLLRRGMLKREVRRRSSF